MKPTPQHRQRDPSARIVRLFDHEPPIDWELADLDDVVRSAVGPEPDVAGEPLRPSRRSPHRR